MLRQGITTAVTTAALLLLGSPATPSTASAHGLGSSPEQAERAAMGTVDRDWMQNAYYQCNPRPHSEKAYKRGDVAPPTAAVPTIVDESGTILVMATTIRNRNPHGTATFGVMGAQGEELRSGSLSNPGVQRLSGFAPGTRVFIQPRTMGTMVKILTPEQLDACGVALPSGI